MKYSWIPRRGLLQNLEPFDVPPDGLTYCRNWTYARKDGTLTRSKGKEKFTSAAAASGTSVRGIGVLDPFANPDIWDPGHVEQVGASTDDCYVDEDASSISTTGNTIKVGEDVDEFRIGLRFQTINIAQGTTIASAYLKLYLVSVTGTSDVNLRIYGEDVDDAATFSTYSDFNTRYGSKTTAKEDWILTDIEDLATNQWHKSPDLKDVIQEIVDRGSWAANNDMVLFVITTSGDFALEFKSYDSDTSLCAILEINTSNVSPTRPKYYFWTVSNADGFLYDEEDVSTAIDQADVGWAYENQTILYNMLQFKDTDLTFNYLISTDLKNDPQKLDRVAGDSATTDLTATALRFKYMAPWKRRLWGFYLTISGTKYEKSALYSDITDPTGWDTTNQIQHLPGSDEGTGILPFRNILNAYCSGSIWYFDYYPNESDPGKFPAFCHTTAFGHVGANVAQRGIVHFILTESGIAAYQGGSNREIISDGIKEDIEYVLRSNLARLVWMVYHPFYDELWVAHPIDGYTRNVIISRFSFKYNTWTQDDIKEANVMHYIHDVNDNLNPKMIFGGEDGILYKEGTEQNDESAFDADFRSGPLFLAELCEVGGRRRQTNVTELHVWENESLSTGLKIYMKSGDYPWQWSTATWNLIGTMTTNPKLNVKDQVGAWHAIKVLSDDSSEKSSVSQIDIYGEDVGEYV